MFILSMWITLDFNLVNTCDKTVISNYWHIFKKCNQSV